MITEEQAALKAISETKYCYILKRVSIGSISIWKASIPWRCPL